MDRRLDRERSVLRVAVCAHGDDVPSGAADSVEPGSVAEDATAVSAIRHASHVRRDVVLLPSGAHALHLHQYDLIRAALDLYEQVRQEEPGDREDSEKAPRSGAGETNQ